jgi:hypothetical protein
MNTSYSVLLFLNELLLNSGRYGSGELTNITETKTQALNIVNKTKMYKREFIWKRLVV